MENKSGDETNKERGEKRSLSQPLNGRTGCASDSVNVESSAVFSSIPPHGPLLLKLSFEKAFLGASLRIEKS